MRTFMEQCVPPKRSLEENDKKRPAQENFASKQKYKSDRRFILKKLTGDPHDFTRTNDEVHQSIDLCPVMKVFVDTEPYQRLRHVKQLGAAHLVYSSADHNRFQHSIGVAFLAREMCSRIKSKQKSLGTTDKDVLCVTLAGLLHDIGHGPYSHIYEMFRAEVNSEKESDPMLQKEYDKRQFPYVKQDWSHEDSSLLMIDAALESLGLQIDAENLDEPLKQIGDGIDALSMRVFNVDGSSDNKGSESILTSRDLIFVKECIFGKPLPGSNQLIGRLEPHKEWLYDIVANRHNGLDVDKVDYFARDERRSLAQAGKINIQILNDAIVAKANCSRSDCQKCNSGQKHYMICYPQKCVEEVMSFYRFRFKMHCTVYQHKTSTAASAMLSDIMKQADLYHEIEGTNGQKHSISSAVIDKEAFLALDDTIIHDIRKSKSKDLEPARKLAKRFLARDLYKFAGELNISEDESDSALWKRAKNADEIVNELCAIEGTHRDESGEAIALEKEDIIIQCCSWHYGRKRDNPLLSVRFVNRKDFLAGDTILNAYEVKKEDYETILPSKFMKRCIRVYCRDPRKTDLLKHKFETWEIRLKNGFEEAPNTQVNLEFVALAPEVSQQETSLLPMLTQESEDESTVYASTPNKSRKRIVVEQSPSPIKCRTPTSNRKKQRGTTPIPSSFQI